jgi:uncharacterized protein (TIGR00255 family)
MAIRSMTGYGRGEALAGGLKVEVEVSAVNRKQYDLRVNLPRTLAVLEAGIAKAVHAAISRGCVAVAVRLTANGQMAGRHVKVNLALARGYVKALREMQQTLDVSGEITLDMLARLPDLVEHEDLAADTDRVGRLVSRALKAALEELLTMRAREGEALRRDLLRRFQRLRRRHAQIVKLAPEVPRHYRACLQKRLLEAGVGVQLDDAHILREIAVFADRCDITEELVRLDSHFEQVTKLMNGSEPCGRAFDFLCQEVLREINTIGSKANDGRLAHHVIDFKSELERIREQIQNIE